MLPWQGLQTTNHILQASQTMPCGVSSAFVQSMNSKVVAHTDCTRPKLANFCEVVAAAPRGGFLCAALAVALAVVLPAVLCSTHLAIPQDLKAEHVPHMLHADQVVVLNALVIPGHTKFERKSVRAAQHSVMC